MIHERFPGVDVVIPAEIDITEQVQRLSKARIVIATQGAHAANILWSRHLEHYVEISANNDRYVSSMARVLGSTIHRAASIAARPGRTMDPHADHIGDAAALQDILQQL